jgi:DNA-binding NtrC family response regulator
MNKKSVLVVDDEANIRRILQVAFEKAGWHVRVAEDAEHAERMLEDAPADCLLTDVTMPGKTGYQLQRECRERYPAMPVVIMTAFGTIPQAVQAIRDGAFEFVTKPFDLDQLRKVVKAALESTPEPRTVRSSVEPSTTFIAESQSMKEVLETVRQVADSRATVLVTGESGTGKEVVSKLLHELSPRSKGPFVAVSCAALPETLLESELFGYEKGAFTGATASKAGRFEGANGGTLLLDEIGEIPLATQVKLLRVLQEREFERLGATKPVKVDVRLVTATNRNLQHAVEEGTFRLDLLYRLQVVEIWLPSLRDRKEDILPLAHHFLARFAKENDRSLESIDGEASTILQNYAWPGNVRELENMMERAAVLAGKDERVLTARHLPPSLRRAA